jgi:hypothetical protein
MTEEQKQQSSGEKTKSESDYRQIIFTALFELVWFSGDVAFWWNESHIIFLWWGVLGLVVAILRHIPSLRIALSASILLILLACIMQPYLPPMPKHETSTHGWLIPANDPIPPNACDKSMPSIPKDALLILFGDSATVLGHLENRDKKLPPLSIVTIADCSVLSIEKGPKGISVNADIFAEDGNLAARIKHNEFHLVQNEISYSERDEDDPSRIAVYDRDGNELLWVRYVNPQALEVRGVFRCRKSQPVIATKDKVIRSGPRPINLFGSCAEAYNAPNLVGAFHF